GDQPTVLLPLGVPEPPPFRGLQNLERAVQTRMQPRLHRHHLERHVTRSRELKNVVHQPTHRLGITELPPEHVLLDDEAERYRRSVPHRRLPLHSCSELHLQLLVCPQRDRALEHRPRIRLRLQQPRNQPALIRTQTHRLPLQPRPPPEPRREPRLPPRQMPRGLPQRTGVAQGLLRALHERLVRHPASQLHRLDRVFRVLDPRAEVGPAQPRVLAQRLDDGPERPQAVRRMRLPLALPHRPRRNRPHTAGAPGRRLPLDPDHVHPPPLSSPPHRTAAAVSSAARVHPKTGGSSDVPSTLRVHTLTQRTGYHTRPRPRPTATLRSRRSGTSRPYPPLTCGNTQAARPLRALPPTTGGRGRTWPRRTSWKVQSCRTEPTSTP